VRWSVPGEDKQKPANLIQEVEGIDQSSIIITDPHYFEIFKYDWLAGSPLTSLQNPFKVVLSESKARKYFGSLSLDKLLEERSFIMIH